MNGPVLTLLAVIIAALFATGGLALLWPARARAAVGGTGAGLAGLTGVVALLALLLPGAPATLALPVGLPGSPFTLALDPLSEGFLLLVAFAGTAALVYAAQAIPAADAGPLAAPPLALAGLLLAVLAADGLTLAFGLALGGGGIWALGSGRGIAPPSAPAPAGLAFGGTSTAAQPHAAHPAGASSTAHPAATHRYTAAPSAAAPALQAPNFALLVVPLLAAAATVVALALLAPTGAGLSFATIRAHPPGIGRATWAELVGLAGFGALIGLAPLHAWLIPAHRALPAHGAALLSGALLPVGLYALLRLVLDLGEPAAPTACSIPLLLAGSASILIGGWRACRDTTLDGPVAIGTLRQMGVAAVGLALVVMGRAADLPNLAALAVAAVLLLACQQAVCGTLALLAAGAVAQQAGTRRLDRLGGLSHRMPVATAGLAVGLFGMAGLPPLPGFAALYLLVQAVLAGPRGGGLGLPLLLGGLILLLALGSALATVAATRLVGVVCLGRPRVPRAAAADELPSAARPVLLVPLVLTCLLGVLPGPALRLVFGAAIGGLTENGIAEHLGWASLTPTAGSPGYAPLPLALLLTLAAGGAFWLLHRRARHDLRIAPLWQDGFAAPPPWLPFGDPVTQWNGAITPPWRGSLAVALRWDRPASAGQALLRDGPPSTDRAAAPGGSLVSHHTAFPSGAVRTGAVPMGTVPTGTVPTGAVPTGAVPTGPGPTGAVPTGAVPTGAVPTGVVSPAAAVSALSGHLRGWAVRAGRRLSAPKIALAAIGVLLALLTWGRPP